MLNQETASREGAPINRAKITVTAYACAVCDKFHRKPSKKFFAHFNASAKKHGFAPLPTP